MAINPRHPSLSVVQPHHAGRGRPNLELVSGTDDIVNTVGPTVLRYVASRRSAHEIGKATAYRYRTILIGFGQIIGTEIPMARVKRTHLDRWFAQRDKDGVAASTMSHEWSILSSFFAWAVDTDLIPRSPCAGMKGPKRPESKARSMEGNEVALTLESCPDARARAIATLMVQCGLRCCEVSRMETSDVSLHDRVMRVHGKGDKTRWLPIPDEALSALIDYFAEFPPLAGPVFRSYHHGSRGLTPGRVGEIVRLAMRDAGVKKRARDGKSAHALRHTFASDLVEDGVDVEDLREAMGHSSLATLSIYTKKTRALARLTGAMEGRTYRNGADVPKDVA